MGPIGRNILRLMKERNLSLPRLAVRAGVDKSQLSKIVRFGTDYSPASLNKLATALNVSLGALFADDTARLPAGMRRIPILDSVQVAAFTDGALLAPETGFPEFAMTCATCSDSAFAYYVTKPDMLPDFAPGDVVVVDPERPPQPGQFVMAIIGSDVLLRRYAHRGINAAGVDVYELIPSNPVFPSHRSDQHQIRIAGVVRQRVIELP